MKKNPSFIFVLSMLLASQWTAAATARLSIHGNRQTEVQAVTLQSRIGHKIEGYGESAFSFSHGLRSDSEMWQTVTHNNDELLYGSISINGDSDWFSVSAGGPNPSKIKDLGALDWSDVESVPELPATAPTSQGLRFAGPNENIEVTSENRITKAVAGHLYLVHVKNRESDSYVMFRVDELVANDNCTIAWKRVPSPEKPEAK